MDEKITLDDFKKAVEQKTNDQKENRVIDIVKDIDEYLKHTRDELKEENFTISGYDNLDKYLLGWRKKSLYTLVGGAGFGKSLFLLNFAIQAAKQGKNVILFTLEMEKYTYTRRAYSILFEKPLQNILFMDESKIKEKLILHTKPTSITKFGRLKIFEGEPKELSVYEMARNIEPDDQIVVVDYAELLTAETDRRDAYYLEINDIFYQLKAVAKMLDKPIITAGQMNRGGLGDKGGTKDFVGQQHVQGSLGINQISDVVLSIKQTPADKQNDVICLDITKNRSGPSSVVLAFDIEYKSGKIKDVGFPTGERIAKAVKPKDGRDTTDKVVEKPVYNKKGVQTGYQTAPYEKEDKEYSKEELEAIRKENRRKY